MYVLIAGGGKVGANLARTLMRMRHEVTLIEQRQDRFGHVRYRYLGYRYLRHGDVGHRHHCACCAENRLFLDGQRCRR